MRLLLDTHAFLWFIGGNSRMSARARQFIEDPDNLRFLSMASLWEIAIKSNLGKLQLDPPFSDLFPREAHANSIGLLDITADDVTAVATLPHHHRDPFDRMLIAQAMLRDLSVVGADAALTLMACAGCGD